MVSMFMQERHKRAICWLVITWLLFIMGGCSAEQHSHQTNNKLQVVTTIAPLSYFVERIGGNHVTISVMVPPGGNPHTYEPSPKQLTELAQAHLFVGAGSNVAFELDWLKRLLSLNQQLQFCNAAEGITFRTMKEAHYHENETNTSSHERAQYDPHYWLTPANGVLIARNVATALAKTDATHAAEYNANAATLIAELQTLEQEIRKELAPLKQRRFLVFHPAWGYYADAFGLEQLSLEVEGKTLTPRQMQRVIALAREQNIHTIFVSPQFNTMQAATIATDINGVTATVDPLSSDYQNNLRQATKAFVQAMQ